mgnify:CR=1 FL=1
MIKTRVSLHTLASPERLGNYRCAAFSGRFFRRRHVVAQVHRQRLFRLHAFAARPGEAGQAEQVLGMRQQARVQRGEAKLGDLTFTAVDTAGLEEADAESLSGRMRAQTEEAIRTRLEPLLKELGV